jgi:hypothetical protein
MRLPFIIAVLVNANVTSAFSIVRTPRTESAMTTMSLALSTLDSKTTNPPNIRVSQSIDDEDMEVRFIEMA